jgi:hypothetical protein
MRPRHTKDAVHVVLTLGALSDPEMVSLGANIAKMAPTSALFQQNPGMQPLVTDIGSQNVVLGNMAAAIAKAEADLVTMKETRDNSRDQLEKSIVGLRGFVEARAATVADANAIGFIARSGRAPTAPLTTPDGVIVHLGKKHGQFIVTVKTSLKRAKFGAQLSADPIGPATWGDLPGNGKRRIVTGHASGTVVWVRFRTLRGASASDWCAPVSVVVP